MKNKDLFFVPFPIVRSVVRRPSSVVVVGIPVHRSSGVRSTSVGCFAVARGWMETHPPTPGETIFFFCIRLRFGYYIAIRTRLFFITRVFFLWIFRVSIASSDVDEVMTSYDDEKTDRLTR